MKAFIASATLLLITCCLQADGQATTYAQKLESTSSYDAKAVVNARANAQFKKLFPNVADESWGVTPEGDYSVSFTCNNIQELAFFSRNGNLLSTIRYYSKKELPADVLSIVKFVYPGYSIKGVREVTTSRNTAYLVTVETDDEWKVIRVINGDTDVFEQHAKAKN